MVVGYDRTDRIRDSVQSPAAGLWTVPRHYAFCGESSDDWPVFSDEDEYLLWALFLGSIGPDSPRLALSQPDWFEDGTYGRSKHMSADDLASKQRPWPFGRPKTVISL
jgi:hypothetical protein